jgi:ATP-dependent Clp protease ATP-binding subunit ClpA
LLKHSLRPEFLNRIDEIIVFNPLDKNAIADIVRLQFRQIARRAWEQGFTLKLADSAAQQLALWGYDPVFGARPLKRVLQREVTNRLSQEILAGRLAAGCEVTVEAVNGEIVMTSRRDESRLTEKVGA